MLALLLACFIWFPFQLNIDNSEQWVINQINLNRGGMPLRIDTTLVRTAQAQLESGSHEYLTERAASCEAIPGTYFQEFITAETVNEVYDILLRSNTVFDRKYTHVGIASRRDYNNQLFWVIVLRG